MITLELAYYVTVLPSPYTKASLTDYVTVLLSPYTKASLTDYVTVLLLSHTTYIDKVYYCYYNPCLHRE